MVMQLQNVVETFVDIVTTDKGMSHEDISLRALLVCCDTARLANGVLLELTHNGEEFSITATREDLARVFDGNGPMATDTWKALKNGDYATQVLDSRTALDGDATSVFKSLGTARLHYFPVRRHGDVAGLIVLLDRSLHDRDDDFAVYVQGVASAAMAVADGERRLSQAVAMVGQLSTALETRVLLEQAKGVIAERYSMNAGQAFGWLRSLARNERGKLRDVAERIVLSTDKSPMTRHDVDSTSVDPMTYSRSLETHQMNNA